MADTPFFSIIMPVYGVEAYLRDSVGCILNQTYPNFEIILIDDRGKDRSGEICDELAAEDSRIRVIHLPENGGVSNARNQGLAAVRGKYVLMLDPDDIFDSDLLSTAYDAIRKNPAEVTVYGVIEEHFNDKNELKFERRVSTDLDYSFNNQQDLRKYLIELEQKTLYGYPTNKVYETEHLRKSQAKFDPSKSLLEDIEFNVIFFQNVTRLNVLSFTPYHYKKRYSTSLTNKFVKEYFDLHRERVEMILNQYKSWDLCDNNIKTILAQIYTRYITSALQRNCEKASDMNGKDRKEWLKRLYRDELWQELSPHLQLKPSMIGIMGWLLVHEKSLCVLSAAKFIYFVRKTFPILFSLIKGKA